MFPRAVVWLCFAVISLLAAGLTIHDKQCAKHRRYRVPEATLLWVAAAGGAAAMFLTMLAIRHKTRHIKFMAGLPALMLLHAGILCLLRWKLGTPAVTFFFG